MTRNYIIGIIILSVIIIASWLVSALGSDKYIAVDVSDSNTTPASVASATPSELIETATSTIIKN